MSGGNLPRAVAKIENAHSDSVWAASWCGGDGRLLTGSLDGSLKLWNKPTASEAGKPLCASPKQRVGITSVVATSDGTMAVACYQDSTIRFFNLQDPSTMVEESVIDPGLQEAWSICLSPVDDVIAAGSHDGKVNFFSMERSAEDGNRRLIMALETGNKLVMSTAFSKGEDAKLATSSVDGFVNIFDMSTQQLVHKVEAHAMSARSVCFSPDGKLVYSASDDRHVNVFDTVSGASVGTFSHAGMALCVDASPDHRHFVVGGSDHSVFLWDLGMQRLITHNI